jgi:hypothetical protein
VGKRILLFLTTNLAAALTVCVLAVILGAVGFATGPADMPLLWVAGASLAWGMGGGLLTLLLSRSFAKRALAVRLLDGKSGDNDIDWVFDYVQDLAAKCRLTMPEVGVYDSSTP